MEDGRWTMNYRSEPIVYVYRLSSVVHRPEKVLMQPPLARPELTTLRRLRPWLAGAVIALVLLFFARAVANEWGEITRYNWAVQPGWLAAGLVLTLARGPLILAGWRMLLAR